MYLSEWLPCSWWSWCSCIIWFLLSCWDSGCSLSFCGAVRSTGLSPWYLINSFAERLYEAWEQWLSSQHRNHKEIYGRFISRSTGKVREIKSILQSIIESKQHQGSGCCSTSKNRTHWISDIYDICESLDRKSTRLNSSHMSESRMPSSAWKKKN